MIVLENAAYLVDDERRRAVFERLHREVGVDPEALLAVPPAALAEIIAAGGMLPAHRAAKVQRAAEIGREIGVAELRRQVRAGSGKKTLRRFPGIGEPGADRILLFGRAVRGLAPDSNALRVLLRLGFGEPSEDYARAYRSVVAAVAALLPDDFDWLIGAHQLLRRHGQEICRRSRPMCEICPLARECRWYREQGPGESSKLS